MNLSHTRMSKYLTCPRQEWLHYHERWRPRRTSATLRFGRAVDAALTQHFMAGEDPLEVFHREWEAAREEELDYGSRDTWESLRDTGEALLTMFMDQHRWRIVEVYGVQQKFQVDVSESLSLVGYIDLVADLADDSGEIATTIIDWKTASSSYDAIRVALDDQLTMYALGSRTLRPRPVQVAYCTFLKLKSPRIEWHFARRGDETVEALIQKARWVYEQILAGVNHANPGQHCSWCDFAPICVGDEAAIAETLVQEKEAVEV